MYTLMMADGDNGDYSFSGKPVVERAVYLALSEEELNHVIHQIKEHTKTKSRDYVLLFRYKSNKVDRNIKPDLLAIDNLSNSDIEELRQAGYSENEIAPHHYYTLMVNTMEIN